MKSKLNYFYKKICSLLKITLGYCYKCDVYFKYPKVRRMNTSYIDEKSNYCRVCAKCFADIEKCWQDLWDEYYSGRL